MSARSPHRSPHDAPGADGNTSPEPLEFSVCRSAADLAALRASPRSRRRFLLEAEIAFRHQADEEFELHGYCLLEERPAAFRVDWMYCDEPGPDPSPDRTGSLRLPNWRERLLCSGCGLNNRQRAVAVESLAAIGRQRDRRGGPPSVYLTEQVTPMAQHMSARELDVDLALSEFLGPEIEPGSVIDGLRHETLLDLSFADASLDLVVCCSVLEHMPQPERGVAEIARCLRPGGEVLLEIPFFIDLDRTRTRAEVRGGEVHHLHPPAYHGDPMSADGSLVFSDFGWDFLEIMRSAGFEAPEMLVYWSLEYGHLGAEQFFFRAVRSG